MDLGGHSLPSSCPAVQILEAINSILPSIREMVDLFSAECVSKSSSNSQCQSCPQKQKCKQICEQLEAHLPKPNSGKLINENLTGLYENTLSKNIQDRRLAIFHQYEACKQIFTDKQWAVICFYWRDGKTQEEIAKKLSRTTSTINEHLKNSKKRIDKHKQNLRIEKLEHLKKNNHDNP